MDDHTSEIRWGNMKFLKRIGLLSMLVLHMDEAMLISKVKIMTPNDKKLKKYDLSAFKVLFKIEISRCSYRNSISPWSSKLKLVVVRKL